ncbi:alpha-protein kinase 2 [Rhinatrema bivittatum]|uniref:alpha-protein kinase 2 n=1 Tax=Rhinatrema bivittatum TaxID=194408 RepID=UPI00112CD891|nr:alpha-protein kinase 2 [Rhinatrema bivittatum]
MALLPFQKSSPHFTSSLHSQSVPENSKVSLSCAISGNLEPELIQYKNGPQRRMLSGLPRQELQQGQVVHTLNCFRSTEQEAVIYQVSAINRPGMVSGSTMIEITKSIICQTMFQKLQGNAGINPRSKEHSDQDEGRSETDQKEQHFMEKRSPSKESIHSTCITSYFVTEENNDSPLETLLETEELSFLLNHSCVLHCFKGKMDVSNINKFQKNTYRSNMPITARGLIWNECHYRQIYFKSFSQIDCMDNCHNTYSFMTSLLGEENDSYESSDSKILPAKNTPLPSNYYTSTFKDASEKCNRNVELQPAKNLITAAKLLPDDLDRLECSDVRMDYSKGTWLSTLQWKGAELSLESNQHGEMGLTQDPFIGCDHFLSKAARPSQMSGNIVVKNTTIRFCDNHSKSTEEGVGGDLPTWIQSVLQTEMVLILGQHYNETSTVKARTTCKLSGASLAIQNDCTRTEEGNTENSRFGDIYFLIQQYMVSLIKEIDSCHSLADSSIGQNSAIMTRRTNYATKRIQDLDGIVRHFAEEKCQEVNDDLKESATGIVLNLVDAKGYRRHTLNQSNMEDLFKTRTDGPKISRQSYGEGCVSLNCHQTETESLHSCSDILCMKGDKSCNFEKKWASGFSELNQESLECTVPMVQSQDSLKEYGKEGFKQPTVSSEPETDHPMTLIVSPQNEVIKDLVSALETSYIKHQSNQNLAEQRLDMYENKNDNQQLVSMSNEDIPKISDVASNANLSFKKVNCFVQDICFEQGDFCMVQRKTLCAFKPPENMGEQGVKIEKLCSSSSTSNNREKCYGDMNPYCEAPSNKLLSQTSSQEVFEKLEQKVGDSPKADNRHEMKTIHAKEISDQIGQYVEGDRGQQEEALGSVEVQKVTCIESAKNESLKELLTHLLLNTKQAELCTVPGDSSHAFTAPENINDDREIKEKIFICHDRSKKDECKDNIDTFHQAQPNKLNSDVMSETFIEKPGFHDGNNLEKDTARHGPRTDHAEENCGQHIKGSEAQQVEKLEIMGTGTFQEITCITSYGNDSAIQGLINYVLDMSTIPIRKGNLSLASMAPLHVFPISENLSNDQIPAEKSLVLDSHDGSNRTNNADPTYGASYDKYVPALPPHHALETFHEGGSDLSISNDGGLQHPPKKQDFEHTCIHRNRENEDWDIFPNVLVVRSAQLNSLSGALESNVHKNPTIFDRLITEPEMKLKKKIEGKKGRLTETVKANKIAVENIFSSQASKVGEGAGYFITEPETEAHSLHVLAKNSVEHLDFNPTITLIDNKPVKIFDSVKNNDPANSSLKSHVYIPVHEISSCKHTPAECNDRGRVPQGCKLPAGEKDAKPVKDSSVDFVEQGSPNDAYIQHSQGVKIHSYLPKLLEKENSCSKSEYGHSNQHASEVQPIAEAVDRNSNSFQRPGNELQLNVSDSNNLCSSQLLSCCDSNNFNILPAAQNSCILKEMQNALKKPEPAANLEIQNPTVQDKKNSEFGKSISASAEDHLLTDNLLIGCKYEEKRTQREKNAFDVDCGAKVTHIDVPIPEQPSLLHPSESQSTCNESKGILIVAEVSKEFSKGPSACHPDDPSSIATDGLSQSFAEHESSAVKSEGNSTANETGKVEMNDHTDCSIICPQYLNLQRVPEPSTQKEKCTRRNPFRTESSNAESIQQPDPLQMEETRKEETFNYKSELRQVEFHGKKDNRTDKGIATACGNKKQSEEIHNVEKSAHRLCILSDLQSCSKGNTAEYSLPALTHCTQKSKVSFQKFSVPNATTTTSSKTVELNRKSNNFKLSATEEIHGPLVADKLLPSSSVPKHIPQFQEKLRIKNKESDLLKSVNNILSAKHDNRKEQRFRCNKIPANATRPGMVKSGPGIINNIYLTKGTEKIISKLTPQKCKEGKKEHFSNNLRCIKEKPSMVTEILPKKEDIKEQGKVTDSTKGIQKAPRLLKEIQAQMFPDCSGNMKLCCQFTEIHGDSTITWTKDSKLLSRVHGSVQDNSPVSLTIVQTSKKDQGLYQCCMKNIYGKVTTEFNLTTEVLDSLSSCRNLEGGEEIEFNQLLFREDFICDSYFGGLLHGRIITEELHFGEGVHRKAFRSKVMYGLVPVFSPGHLCVLKVHSAIAYGAKTNAELVQRNYRLAVQECYVQNTAREYAKIYASEVEPLEGFGDVPEIIPIFLIHRPTNNIPYATVEEELIGEFVKYSIRDGKEINFKRRESEAGQKSCTFQHWVYQKTNGNLLVTDMQGVGMKLTDVGIATLAKGYKGFKGNCPVSFIDQFKVLHQCNKYCEMLGLKSLQSDLHKQRKSMPAKTNGPPNSSKLQKTVLGVQSKSKT